MPAKFVFNRAYRRKAGYYPPRKGCNNETGTFYAVGDGYQIDQGNVWFRSHEEWPFPPCATPQQLREGFYGPRIMYKW